jgi:hypothetical protein
MARLAFADLSSCGHPISAKLYGRCLFRAAREW